MTETHKKHFGEPVHQNPMSFGKHYTRRDKDNAAEKNAEQHTEISESVEGIYSDDPIVLEQKHRHLLENRALRNGAIANIFGILCWLVFCLGLLCVAVTQINNSLIVAVAVPVAGFIMICWLAYLKKADIGKRHFNNKPRHFSKPHSGNNNFRKPYKPR